MTFVVSFRTDWRISNAGKYKGIIRITTFKPRKTTIHQIKVSRILW